MLAGALAIAFRKGSRGHRRAGNVFVICMLSVAALGSYLGFMKGEMDNFTGGIFAFYLVATAWATAKQGESPTAGQAHRVTDTQGIAAGESDGGSVKRTNLRKLDCFAPPVALTFAAINFLWGVEVARGQTAVKNQSPAGAYFFFGTLALLSATGDVRMLLGGGLFGRQRLVRHLWRMCFGWFIATVSFFLGQQQVFPGWLRGSYVLVWLAFLPLLFLIFWVIRVRLTNKYAKAWVVSGR